MGIVLIGKSLSFVTGGFIILPLINISNHTGTARLIPVYLGVIFLSLFVSYFSVESIDLKIIVPLLFFFIIHTFQYTREYFGRQSRDLYSRIDSVYGERFIKPHEVYKFILKELNTSLFGKLFIIKTIACFKVLEEKSLVLVNSSTFCQKYWVDFPSEFLIESPYDRYLLGINIEFNNISYKNTISIKVSTKYQQYIFVFIGGRKVGETNFILNSLIIKILIPLMKKVSKVLATEDFINNIKKRGIRKHKKNMRYILGNVKAMHFVNNKLTPLTNYFAMLNSLGTLKDEEKKKLIKNIIKQETIKCQESLTMISKKARNILDKTINPYTKYTPKQENVLKIYDILRRVWEQHFLSNECIEFQILNSKEEEVRSNIQIDLENIEVLFTDIIENMFKYNNGNYSCVLTVTENNAIFVFRNNFQPDSKKRIEEVVRFFNLNEGVNLNHLRSHGMELIKNSLLKLKSEHQLILDESFFSLEFKLKTEKNENRNI